MSNKISFLSYSIFNLHLPSYSSGLPLPRRQLVYITTNRFPLSSIFSNFFKNFLIFFKFFIFACHFRNSLYILPLSFSFVKRFFALFLNFLNFFQKKCYFDVLTKLKTTFSPLISTSFVISAFAAPPSLTEIAKTSSWKAADESASLDFPSAI